jgi:hypothetical protein
MFFIVTAIANPRNQKNETAVDSPRAAGVERFDTTIHLAPAKPTGGSPKY